MAEPSKFTRIEAESPHADDHLSSSEALLEESERPPFLEKTDQLVAAFGLRPESRPVVFEGLVQALYAIALDERRANATSEAFARLPYPKSRG
ncbi:MAG TPA: hypothetical protein VMR86_09360 [Myxococcota bacterium]|nr:hypothetical protein [Myxococcota bacterium]